MNTNKDGDESRATLGPGNRPGEPLEPLERQRGTDTLDDQRNRLSRLRGFEEQLRTLRERECELEVERIAADAALKTASAHACLDLELEVAAELGEAFERKRHLEAVLARLERDEA